ncbi:MAG: hypothetical protein AAF849_22325 [Bacteroidota bacterium]
METTTKRKSQPWWVIFLIIPILVSCTSPIAWSVSAYIGKILIKTYAGPVIELAVDTVITEIENIIQIWENSHPPDSPNTENDNSPGHVIEDKNNPLCGTYSTKMKFAFNDSTGELTVVELDKPRMCRDSKTSRWKLDPKLRESLKQIQKK